MRAERECLTPQQHLDKAEGALAAAQKVRAEMDAREKERGPALGKASEWYLTREHDFLTLMQIANLHANLATAKSIAQLAKSLSLPSVSTSEGPDF